MFFFTQKYSKQNNKIFALSSLAHACFSHENTKRGRSVSTAKSSKRLGSKALSDAEEHG
jgi:hypothetical protein